MKDHTVEYTSIDYHSMCEKSKKQVKDMRKAGFSTIFDPKPTPEETEKKQMGGYSIVMMGK